MGGCGIRIAGGDGCGCRCCGCCESGGRSEGGIFVGGMCVEFDTVGMRWVFDGKGVFLFR